MTPELEERWRSTSAPFDGNAIVTVDEPDLEDLRAMLVLARDVLRPLSPEILVYRDWHEHDGFVTAATPYEWDMLTQSLRNSRTLYDSRDDDDGVRVALFPPSFEWLLRYNIDDESDEWSEAWCDLDFACTPTSAAYDLIAALKSRWPGYCDVIVAKEYFDKAYGG